MFFVRGLVLSLFFFCPRVFGMPEPTISLITAVYNSADTVCASIDSALGQSYPHLELIVVDGGSTDGTVQLLKDYGDKIDKLISEKDKGLYDALNKGISKASGDIIGFMHADDQFQNQDVLKRVAAAFQESPVDAIYGDLVYVKRSDPDKVVRYWKGEDFGHADLALGWVPPHPTFYMKRGLYKKFGGFDLQYRISADYDLMLRYFGRHKISTRYIPEIMVRMRTGGTSNNSLSTIIDKLREDYKILRAHHIGGMTAVLMKRLRKIPQFFVSGEKVSGHCDPGDNIMSKPPLTAAEHRDQVPMSQELDSHRQTPETTDQDPACHESGQMRPSCQCRL